MPIRAFTIPILAFTMVRCARAFMGDTGPIDIGDTDRSLFRAYFDRAQLVTGGRMSPSCGLSSSMKPSEMSEK